MKISAIIEFLDSMFSFQKQSILMSFSAHADCILERLHSIWSNLLLEVFPSEFSDWKHIGFAF